LGGRFDEPPRNWAVEGLIWGRFGWRALPPLCGGVRCGRFVKEIRRRSRRLGLECAGVRHRAGCLHRNPSIESHSSRPVNGRARQAGERGSTDRFGPQGRAGRVSDPLCRRAGRRHRPASERPSCEEFPRVTKVRPGRTSRISRPGRRLLGAALSRAAHRSAAAAQGGR
jgi:hypothetical protein